MQNPILLAIFLILNQLAFAQNISATWYGEKENPNDIANRMAKTSDGGFVITGKTSPSPDQKFDAFLLKTDSTGKMLWQKTFGSTDNEEGLDVLALPDGSIVFCGYTENQEACKSQGFVVKTDSEGNQIWSFVLDNFEYQQVSCLAATADGGLLFGGSQLSDRWQSFCGKIDSTGNLLFQHLFSYQINEKAVQIFESKNNSPILFVEVQNAAAHSLFEYLLDGNEIWHYKYEDPFGQIQAPKTTVFKNKSGDIWLASLIDNENCIVFNLDKNQTDTLHGNFFYADFLQFQDDSLDIFIKSAANSFKTEHWIYDGDTFEKGSLVGSTWDSYGSNSIQSLPIFEGKIVVLKAISRLSESPDKDFSLTQIRLQSNETSPDWNEFFGKSGAIYDEFVIARSRQPNGRHLILVGGNPVSTFGYPQFQTKVSIWLADGTGKILSKNENALHFPGSFFGNTFSIIDIKPMLGGGLALLLLDWNSSGAIYVVKIHSKGYVESQIRLEILDNWYNLEELLLRPDGGFAVVLTKSFGSRQSFYLFDAAGKLAGLRRIGQESDRIQAFATALDGTFVAFGLETGTANFKYLFLKTDGFWGESQRVVNASGLDQPPFFAPGKSILMPTSDGGFLAAAPDGWFFGGKFLVIKFDKNGAVQWTTSLELGNNANDFSISEIPGRGYLVESFMGYFTDAVPLCETEKDTKIAIQFIDYQGKTTDQNIINLFPEVVQSNPNFMENYTYSGWSGVLHGVTRDLVFVQAETARNPNSLPAENLEIYPNPSNNELAMAFSNPFLGKIGVEIFTAAGQLVHQFSSEKTGEAWYFQMSDPHFRQGAYLIRVRAGADVFCGKWVKI